jgi:hypothetical protein
MLSDGGEIEGVGEANCVLCLDGHRGNGDYTRNRFVGVNEVYKPVN